MRRYSFFVGALSAVLTFVALSAFTGRRPWTREGRWPYVWHRHSCDRDGRDNYDGPEHGLRWRNNDRQRAMPVDSSEKVNPAPDSILGR